MSLGYSALGFLLGACIQHSWSSVSSWWRPAPSGFPSCAGVETLTAEVRGLRETAFSSQLATGLAVGGVVASVLVSLWIAERFWASSARRSGQLAYPAAKARALPAQHFDLSPRPLRALPSSLDEQLDALEADPDALARYVPRQQ